ncbi:hypothetical protein GCM10008018_57560 [Paenibacillus marchantiophytorum]|uniref:HTH cro/C1-type domain-containing protein n=1 Tax=Paenibacillus marchantiophytorum TaxID=1619310 RepID=A0ABQ1F9P8_9BACL|nr:helix-turn-helix domain-containing protein [Paenibacillus marchantiophytorum]GGA04121.1 hypothetical protein GCM10008018_57560 [Paenibacillus marchantiophytorum]
MTIEGGKFLKKRRIERGYKTQEDLTFKCWIPQGQISSYERGDKTPSLETLQILGKALDTSYVEMFEGINVTLPLDLGLQLNIQDQIDTQLLNQLKDIISKILIQRDGTLQARFLELLQQELGAPHATALKEKFKDLMKQTDSMTDRPPTWDEAMQKICRTESLRRFYSIVRRYPSGDYRRDLIDKLKQIQAATDMPLQNNELTNQAIEYSVDNEKLTEKERLMAVDLIRSMRNHQL